MENLLELVLLKVHIKASSYHICTWKAPDVIPSWCPPLWNGVELRLAVSWCDSAASSRWLPWFTQEPFCSQSCDGAVAWELLVSHTWLQVTNGPFLLQRVQMFLLRLFLQIRMGGLDASWRDWLASAFQALLLPGEIWCWVSKVTKSPLTSPSSCPRVSLQWKFVNKGAGRDPYQSLPQTAYSLSHEDPQQNV